MNNTSILVNLWGQCIGELHWCPNINNTLFSFTESYFNDDLNVFPIIADKEIARKSNYFYGEVKPIYKLLPSFLFESLPDSWERGFLNTQLKGNNKLSKGISPIEKLAYIRNRCLGALEYQPSENINKESDLYWFCQMADDYEKYLRSIKLPSLFKTDLESISSLGTCSVGLRPKVLLAICRDTGEVRSGQIEQGINYDYYILKIGDMNTCWAEIEMAYYQIATNAGIKMMSSQLISIDGAYHFLTKRYDRTNNKKLHVQSLAALSPQSSSYEDLFEIAEKLKLTREDIIELYRRLLFNVVIHNIDDHARNFSFIMDATGKWSLSPAYDISYPITERNNHNMTLNGKNENFKMDDILSIAYTYRILNHEEIYQKILSAVSCLNTILEINGVVGKFNKTICKRVSENMNILQS